MALSVSLSTIDRLILATSTRFGVIAAATDPQIQTLTDAMDAIILGSSLKAVKSEDTVIDVGVATPPSDDDANRGNKWLMRFQDAVGNIYTHELGTADNSQLSSPTSDFIDLTAGTGLALKNAFDAIYEGKSSETGVLLSVQQVSRTD